MGVAVRGRQLRERLKTRVGRHCAKERERVCGVDERQQNERSGVIGVFAKDTCELTEDRIGLVLRVSRVRHEVRGWLTTKA